MPTPATPAWRPLELWPATALTAEVSEVDFEDEAGWFCHVVRLTVRGEVRPGSLGKPDTAWLKATAAATLAATCHPDVLLLDFTDLGYQWGDGMLGLMQTIHEFDAEEPIEVVIAAGPGCHPALASLLPHAGDALQPDLERAWPVACARARARSQRVG